MTSYIKAHPAVDALIFTATFAKIISSDRWFSNKMADLRIAQNILQNANVAPHEAASLKKYIFRKNLAISGLRNFNNWLFPIALTAMAFYLDNKLFIKSESPMIRFTASFPPTSPELTLHKPIAVNPPTTDQSKLNKI